MNVYDCFLYFQEKDLLRIRLETLKDKVDYYVLTESTMTFSGKPKPLYFEENKHLFEDFKDRIIHVVVDDTPTTNVSWDRERWQRNAIIRGLEGRCKPTDVILSGDVDEFPDISMIEQWYQTGNVYHPLMEMYYYYLNSYRESNWHGTKICSWEITKDLGIDPLRNVRYGYGIPKNGWHFSYAGGSQAVLNKMDAFSDIELNNSFIREHVKENIDNGKDIFFRGQTMKIIPIDDSFPKYIRDNEIKLIEKGLIKNYAA